MRSSPSWTVRLAAVAGLTLAALLPCREARGERAAEADSETRSNATSSRADGPLRAAPDSAPSAEAVKSARRHFRRGVTFYRADAFGAASAEFTRAYELAPNFRVLYNLAQIEVRREKLVAATRLFRRYLEEGGDEVAPERQAEVQTALEQLRLRIGRLRLELFESDVQLFVDGVPAPQLEEDGSVLLDAGVRHLRWEKSGFLSVERSVVLTGGEEKSLVVELEPAPEARHPAQTPRKPEESRSARLREPKRGPIPLLVAGSTTAVLAASTVVFGLLTRRADRNLERQLEAYPADRDGVDRTRDQVRTRATVTDVLGLATLLAAGATGYVLWSSEDEAERPELDALVGPSKLQLSFSGYF